MPQFALPFKYEEETKTSGLTGLAGLPLYIELLHTLKIQQAMRQSLDTGEDEDRVWKPSQIALTLVLLNLAGGEHVEDLRILQSDSGFYRLMDTITTAAMTHSERRKHKNLQRSQGSGLLPSRSTVFRFLKSDGMEGLSSRGQGKAFIPEPGQTAKHLCAVNKALLAALEHNKPCDSITLDMDATLIETHKADSLYSYKGFSAYQPLNIWWDEHRVLLDTEFRDGNVPAGYKLEPAFRKALSCLPESVKGKRVFLRSDTAAYTIDLLKYCEDEKIEFVIGCPIDESLRKDIKLLPASAWQQLDKLREYAEVCHVPNSLSTSKHGYEFRYIATREALNKQCTLPGLPETDYPFPTEKMAEIQYKIHAVVTNRQLEAEQLILWYNKRCGHSEEVHSVLKNELAGGILPSNHFHANATWWWISVLSHNIHSMFKSLCCDERWLSSRLKCIRFHILCVPGRVVERGRQLYIRLSAGHPSYGFLQSIRQAICRLRACPA
jgi:hypothetical protein